MIYLVGVMPPRPPHPQVHHFNDDNQNSPEQIASIFYMQISKY